MNTLEKCAKNRIIFYDAIKALAIYLVCIYHYNHLNLDILHARNLEVYVNYFFYGMSSIAVPLFFMVNGALLLNKEYTLRKHLKKTICLYLLMFVWSFISLIIFIWIRGDAYSLRAFLRSLFYFEQDVSNHLWFLQALISVYLLLPFIKEIYDSPRRKLLYLFCSIVFVFSFGNLFINTLITIAEFAFGFNLIKSNSFDFFPVINPFGNYYYSLFYFIVGGILSQKKASQELKISSETLLASFLIALLSLFLYGIVKTSLDGSIYDIVWNGYYSIMTLVMSVSIFLFLSRISYNNRTINYFLTNVGSNTLGIYLIHRFVGALTIGHFQNWVMSDSLLLNVLYGIFVTLSSFLLVLAIKKTPLLKSILPS